MTRICFATRWVGVAAIYLTAVASVAAAPLFRGIEGRPADAVVLFNGHDLSKWQAVGGDQPKWVVKNGYMEVRQGSIESRQKFGSCQIHIEFWLPDMPEAHGQGKANSGVYPYGFFEIQVLDSYGIEKPESGDCGGLYSIASPAVNACRPPRTWQTYDLFIQAAEVDSDGKVLKNPVISVLHNGVWIHNNVEITHTTSGGSSGTMTPTGPLMLQDHSNPVRYRNIWVREIK